MRLLPVCLLLSALATPALAEDDTPRIPKDLFPLGEEACFGAAFAPEKMKPGQKLTDLYVYKLFDPHPELENVELPREEGMAFERETGKDASSSSVGIFARFSDSKHVYSQYAGCSVFKDDWGTGRATCGVDCDGGYFSAMKNDKGFELFFDRDSTGLRLNESCDGPSETGAKERYLTDKEAGSPFTMARLPLSACKAADEALHSHMVKDKVSLRERIETQGWRCLRRKYDAAHLKKHPQQKVTAVAVAIKGKPRVEKDEGWPFTKLDVAVSLRLRDGETVSRDISCTAEDVMFQCEGNIWLERRDDKSAFMWAGMYDDLAASHQVLDTELGKDDVQFRLDAGTETECRVD